MREETKSTHAGFIAIIGRPNVGKSTLLNRILQEKLAIVSHRPQTTRNRILGVRTIGQHQLVLLDTPGLHRSRSSLNRFMIREALGSLHGIDGILVVTEVESTRGGGRAPVEPATALARLHPDDTFVLEQLRNRCNEASVVVAVNKIDILRDRRLLLPLMAAWRDQGFSRIVPVCALVGDGVDELVTELLGLLPEGPHPYPAEMLTDRAERFLAAELIREQVFLRGHQEVPYASAVEIERFEERAEHGDVLIEAVIHVEREGQKAILIGKQGAMIKSIGMAARQEIGRLLACPVHLRLSVHVDPSWTDSAAARRRLGYE